MRKLTIASFVLAVVLAVGVATMSAVVLNLNTQVNGLQAKVRTEQAANTSLHTQLAAVQTQTAALNKNSPTGTLITCSDLSDFQKNASMTVSVFNSQYSLTSDGTGYYQGNPWLPPHCLKQ